MYPTMGSFGRRPWSWEGRLLLAKTFTEKRSLSENFPIKNATRFGTEGLIFRHRCPSRRLLPLEMSFRRVVCGVGQTRFAEKGADANYRTTF